MAFWKDGVIEGKNMGMFHVDKQCFRGILVEQVKEKSDAIQ
jgi:hypothetical protein